MTRDASVSSGTVGRYGQTPLSWAVGRGHEAVVKLLVERDDVEASSKGSDSQTTPSWEVEE